MRHTMHSAMRHALFSLIALACTTQPATAQTAPHTAADFAAIPFVSQPVLSPDGQWIAGLYGVSGERQICMVSLFTTLADRKCVGVPDLTEVFGVQWVGNDNILVQLSTVTPVMGDQMQISRIIGVNRVTGNYTRPLWEVMGQNASDILWVAHDGSPNVLIAAQRSFFKETVDRFRGVPNSQDALFWPAVFRVNLATGAVEKVQNGIENVMDWRADTSGRLRMAIAYRDDRGLSAAFYRGEKESLMHSLKAPADGLPWETPEIFVPGGDHAIVLRNGSAKAGDKDKPAAALWEVDLATEADVAKTYEAPAGKRISSTIASADGKSVLGVTLTGSGDEVVWLDKDLASLQETLQKAVGARRAQILSISDDRQHLLVKVDRADTPGSLYMFDYATGKLHALAMMIEKLGNSPLNPVSTVRYKARDGLEIEAILTLPKGRDAKNLPIVVMPHGGPWAHDSLDFDYWAQFIAELGYAVIQPNFRGSTGYGEEFERNGEGQMGLAMQDDVNDALDWAVKAGIADRKRACIIGASYGGYVAMWGLARDADIWRCGVSIAGVASLRRDVNDMQDYLYGRSYQAGWRKMTPDFAAVSPINAVAKIKAPLLLIHGKLDVTVAHNQSSSMAAKLKSAGKPVEFISLPKADHHFTREADRLVLLQSMTFSIPF
jgi:dipeptidyl aminopeptidase/acylaminoacyl peptidase